MQRNDIQDICWLSWANFQRALTTDQASRMLQIRASNWMTADCHRANKDQYSTLDWLLPSVRSYDLSISDHNLMTDQHKSSKISLQNSAKTGYFVQRLESCFSSQASIFQEGQSSTLSWTLEQPARSILSSTRQEQIVTLSLVGWDFRLSWSESYRQIWALKFKSVIHLEYSKISECSSNYQPSKD